jgi:hypothetical protein
MSRVLRLQLPVCSVVAPGETPRIFFTLRGAFETGSLRLGERTRRIRA